MNALVTGGAGYIGSHTCINLLELGHKVLVLDNLSNSKRNALNNISKIVNIRLNTDEGKDDVFSFVQTDIRDKESLEKVFARQKIAMTSEATVMSNPPSRTIPLPDPPSPTVTCLNARSFISSTRRHVTRRESKRSSLCQCI